VEEFTMSRFTAIFCPAAFILASAFPLGAQGPGDVRGLVDKTQADLRRAADFELHAHKQIDRYQKAETRLSDFDRSFTHGHFDRGKLNSSIDSVKDVVEHNTLNPELRDALENDLRDLRMMKAGSQRM
jgi:hypothetical protein